MVLNHFTATGFVFNDAGKMLMIRHKKMGVWLPPGGHLHENELPCEAVLREVFEETGIRARVISAARDAKAPVDGHCRELPLPVEILLEDIERDGSHNHIDMIYLCRTEDSSIYPQESEVDGFGWFYPSEVLELETFENVRKSVRKVVEYMK